MPNLEVLYFDVRLRAPKGNYSDYCGNIGLEYLPSLRELKGYIDCEDVDAAFGALRDACNVHPNHPTFRMYISSY